MYFTWNILCMNVQTRQLLHIATAPTTTLAIARVCFYSLGSKMTVFLKERSTVDLLVGLELLYDVLLSLVALVCGERSHFLRLSKVRAQSLKLTWFIVLGVKLLLGTHFIRLLHLHIFQCS